MSILILVVCMFFIVISLFFDKRIYNPIVLFNFWWGITIFISGFGFYGIYVPSANTYLIMFIAIISFNFSCILTLIGSGKKRFISKQETTTYDNLQTQINYLIGFQLLIMINLIQRSISVFRMLASGMNYERIRYEYFYSDNIMSGYDLLINSYLVTPVITFSMIFISLLLLEKHYNKKLMITTTLCVGLYAFSSGGRGVVLTFGLTMLLAYLIQGRRIKIELSKKIWLLVFLVIVACLLVYITTARGTSADFNDILKTVILYYTASYTYFELLSPFALEDNVLLFGGAFFGGIIDIFIMALRFFANADINTMSSYIGKLNQTNLFVGDNLTYNAFPTMVYTFLYDYNYLGVILGPLLFGLLVMTSYKKMITNNRLAYKGIYIMIALMIYQSVMKWIGISPEPWIVIGMFLIFDYSSRKQRHVNM